MRIFIVKMIIAIDVVIMDITQENVMQKQI